MVWCLSFWKNEWYHMVPSEILSCVFELCFAEIIWNSPIFYSVFHLLKLWFEQLFNLRKLKNPNSKKFSLKTFLFWSECWLWCFEWCFSNLAPILSFSDDFFIENGVYQLCFRQSKSIDCTISLRAKSRALYSYYDNEKKSLKGA